MAIGEAAQGWAVLAIDVPGANQHPLFSLVAAWAALGATLAVDFERAEALLARADAQAPGVSEPAVLQARGVYELFRGAPEEARRHAEAWVDHARTSADPHELAHALLLLAGALPTDTKLRIATLEEQVAVARSAGITSALTTALSFLANNLEPDDSKRALELLDEAAEVSRRLGDRRGVALAMGSKGAMACRHGDWSTALQAACDATEHMRELGGDVTIKDGFHLGGMALVELGHPEAAAVLIGKGDAMSSRTINDWWWGKAIEGADAAIVEALGEGRAAAMAARGAAMATSDAVDYMRADADEVLG